MNEIEFLTHGLRVDAMSQDLFKLSHKEFWTQESGKRKMYATILPVKMASEC